MNKLSDVSTIDRNGILTEILVYLYEQFSVNPLPSELDGIPEEFDEYIKFVYDKNKQPFPTIKSRKSLPVIDNVVERDLCLLAFSGGKDSTASALWLKDKGIKTHLYYVKGINASYPNEEYAAVELAKIMDLPLDIETIRFKGTKDFHESPVKNHLIMASAVDKYYKQGFANYSFGVMTNFTVNKTSIDYDLSDCTEFFQLFANIIRKVYPHFTLRIWWEDEGESNAYLNIKHPDIIQHTQSCMMGLRYRDSLRKRNEEKCNVKLLPNRCGSCYKDAAEYLTMLYFGNVKPNREYIKHCMHVLKQTWKNENPDLLDYTHYSTDKILNESIFKDKLKEYIKKYSD